MDRFIANKNEAGILCVASLKSNMDRFIGFNITASAIFDFTLKSNMDRFIVKLLQVHLVVKVL